jgi:colicin import membrane protein
MTPSTILKLIVLLGATLLGPARAQTIGQAPQGAPGVPVSHSIEQADATLAQVARDRAAVQQRYAQDEQVCYGKFFVNHCLDQAREKRRAALAELRAVEVEANHFKRKDAVERRDAELAERARKDEQEQAARAAQPPRPARAPADETPAPAPKGGPTLEQRQAAHDAQEQRREAEQAAGASRRAANVAAFERKQQESAARQAAIAKKRQEAGARRAAREEAERKKAAAAAAAAASALKQ